MSLLDKAVPVLCYHKISETGGYSPEEFAAHLEMMQNAGYKSITADELHDFLTEGAPLPDKPVVLTFDDCTLDNWVYAVPILNKYGYKGIFFCITDFLHDGEPRTQYGSGAGLPLILPADVSFVNAIGGDCSQFMSRKEIYETVHTYGHEVYSHSVTHSMCFVNLKKVGVVPDVSHWGLNRIYGRLENGLDVYERGSAYAYNGFWPAEADGRQIMRLRSDEERYEFLMRELNESRAELEYIIGRKLDYFCWPWGHFDKLGIKALRESGYKGSFTLERIANTQGTDPLKIGRIGISDGKTTGWLDRRLSMFSLKGTSLIMQKKFRKKREIKHITLLGGLKCTTGMLRAAEAFCMMNINVRVILGRNAHIPEQLSECAEIMHLDFSDSRRSCAEIVKAAGDTDIINSFSSICSDAGFMAAEKLGKDFFITMEDEAPTWPKKYKGLIIVNPDVKGPAKSANVHRISQTGSLYQLGLAYMSIYFG